MYFKFKTGINISTDDPYYDLFVGGYIKPRVMLDDSTQVEELLNAIKLVKQFLNEAEKLSILEIN